MNMTKRIVLIAEFDQGDIKPATMELVTAAFELKNNSPAEISICIAGVSIQFAADFLAECTRCPVKGLEIEESMGYFEEQLAAAVTSEIELDPGDYICIAHTVRGVSLAATLAAKLNAACITGVENIVRTDDGPGFAPNVLGRLGEPFVTTRSQIDDEDTEEAQGMGLGIFIAKTLLERSNAVIILKNREPPESGACVNVVWKRAQFDTV